MARPCRGRGAAQALPGRAGTPLVPVQHEKGRRCVLRKPGCMSMDAEANGKSTKSVAFLVQRMGPYHRARLRSLAADPSLSVHVIEFRADDPVYSWDPVDEAGGYDRLRVSSARE